MFEKSLYDLIRGLRNHKGNERQYIQDSVRECRREIKSQDMDLKATALLKLTYLEMFGYDMSWASFNVLEVMSSPKYLLKRVGYLAAVQSFRADTEVLMLAENLLKKDLMSVTPAIIGLPLGAVPHVINPTMANSLLSDLLPRLSHSQVSIRKKTVVTLYRLAVVYPETLRPAWPKIKERLLDEQEDPSVTAAVVNVVCELGWRRPQDFLPLAPRLFEILVEGKNNWMAIKVIKLFATLTPLEPRLVKKLLPALTNIIKTTMAMSLLYECIDGIVQGGILDSVQGTAEGDEVARLCVSKLRGMLTVERDPNLKYVALLAFQKIVKSHPDLVNAHHDVVLECIDDEDISIRACALDLAGGMVDGENIMTIVDRLVKQLLTAPINAPEDDPKNDRVRNDGMLAVADSDGEDPETSLQAAENITQQAIPLPLEFRNLVIRRILDMCSRDTFANITDDFEWYLRVLLSLVKACPPPSPSSIVEDDVSKEIGNQLLNVGVRVRSMRQEATKAAESLVLLENRGQLFPESSTGGQGVLNDAAWLVGEYSEYLRDPSAVLSSLVHSSSTLLPAETLITYVQAIPKVLGAIGKVQVSPWTEARRSRMSLLLGRASYFLDGLKTHPDLEVQERSVEYLELIKLISEAVLAQAEGTDQPILEAPLLLTQALPSLHSGMELNPVAPAAQRKVTIPEALELEKPIHEDLSSLLIEHFEQDVDTVGEYRSFYFEKERRRLDAVTAAERLEPPKLEVSSYQNSSDEGDSDTKRRQQLERQEKYRDDPFYIGGARGSGTSTPIHDILKANNGDQVDIDAIPIMDLDLTERSDAEPSSRNGQSLTSTRRKPKRDIQILGDENLEDADAGSVDTPRLSSVPSHLDRSKKSALLQVDSSGLGSFSLLGNQGNQLYIEQREAEEKALREIERLRLEMERASIRVQDHVGPPEGTIVRKKKKSKVAKDLASEGTEEVKKKKKKKKKTKAATPMEGMGQQAAQEDSLAPTTKVKKKRRQVAFEEPS
ncbi:Adaptor protein complex AP-3 delta subunit [Eremomyces bilateralis CBS 781.70]|uniref:AP-3 complex subunit delta n=1 Tax=Eremomyces bilateralis CBS 781.70 TaxID=1392243 RepID=A0A6G1GD10_9PEZI|nr:Adaptor protein complex AP-3 delta subunit [Eremomyces bilateralis CBS 781.70]KAF1815968.1 Adaptor protein complex AP-3 delta subunit [Eremomyces bilateralis CBS 781.70]